MSTESANENQSPDSARGPRVIMRSISVATLVVALAAARLLLPSAVWAGGVVTNCTEAALRAAMVGGGTVTFACDGTVALTNTITVATNTVLDATDRRVTISGRGSVRAFSVITNVMFTVVNLTIADGSGGWAGGGIYNAGVLDVQHCVFTNNSARGYDGGYGIAVPGGDGCGGAIYNAGTLSARECAFGANSGVGGSGGQGASPPYPSSGPGEQGGNGGAGRGGAICNDGTMTIESSSFTANSTSGGAGGNGGSGVAWVPVTYPGGGGGMGGDASGGAIFCGGPASLVDCTIAANVANGGGGGNGGSGSWYPVPPTPPGPAGAGGSGGAGYGGICDTTGTLSMTNCTVALNSGTGGALGYGGSNGVNGSAGGGIKSGGTHVLNSLLATNSPGGNCSGWITDVGHNLSSDATCGFTNVGSLNNADPKLAPLADYGGPTLTMALLPGSAAIDAGDTLAAPLTDQRGFPRPAGAAADIGAFELGARPPTLAITCTGGAAVGVVASADPGQSCRLLTSSNLSNWVPMATNQIGTDGTVSFQDTCGPDHARRFYRLAVP